MRILCLDLGLREPTSFYYRWLVPGIEAAGHQLVAVDGCGLASLLGPRAMQEVVMDYVQAYRVDTLLLMQYHMLEPWLLMQLRRMGVRIVSFRYDDANGLIWPGGPRRAASQLQESVKLDRYADLCLTTFRLALEAFSVTGITHMRYMTLPISWQSYPVSDAPIRPVITFCGIPKREDSFRVHALRALKDAGLPLEIYGNGWEIVPDLADICRGPLSTDAMLEMFSTSAVNLCLPGNHATDPRPMLKLRNLEVAACGGMQLTDVCEELADYLDPATDVATFADLPELVAKARQWLEKPQAGREMGRRSRQRCEAGWGWDVWWDKAAAMAVEQGTPLAMDSRPVEPSGPAVQRLAAWATALGHCYEAQGLNGLARDHFQEVLRYRPDDYTALAGLGRLAPSPQAAESYWQQATRVAPDVDPHGITSGLPQLGTTAYATNWKFVSALNWQNAATRTGNVAAFTEAAIAQAATQPDNVMNFAESLFRQGKAEAALQILDAVVERWGDFVRPHALRAQVLMQLRRIDAYRDAMLALTAVQQRVDLTYPLSSGGAPSSR